MGQEGTAPGAAGPGWRPPPRPRVWRTDDVAEGERFAYYREAICEAFMELAPERAGDTAFAARVECVPLGEGAINRVRASPHPVNRTRAEIGRSTRQCYYLNLQLGAECRIAQGGRNLSLKAGQVGIFDSARAFTLHHPMAADLRVASFWVPHEALDRIAGPDARFDGLMLSDHPRLGPLIAATARTLNDRAESLTEAEARTLFDSLLRLTALAAEDDPPLAAHEPALRPALLQALLDFVEARLDDPGLSVALAAVHLGVSKRYVHRLCEGTGRSFTEHVIDRRLDRAVAALTAPPPAEGRTPTLAELAYRTGFSDLSHFNRRFKARFGATPREVRAGGRG